MQKIYTTSIEILSGLNGEKQAILHIPPQTGDEDFSVLA
jgi:hypothetical protein